ncbi:MAG: TolC family protein [Phycisphaerales bacterium]
MQRLLIQLAALLPVLSVVGCAPNQDGMEILESLRREGLLAESSTEPAFSRDRTENRARDAFPAAFPSDGHLTLEDLLQAADRLNPRIAAARAEVGMAGGEAWQSSLYPNPSIEVESENVQPSNRGFGVSETTVGVAQPIIVSGRRDAAVAAGRARMNVEQLEVESVRREVHGRIRRVVTEIVYAQRAIELHRELLELAQRTLDIASARFEARAAPESEAIRARVEANRLGLAVERLRGDLAELNERLDALLGGHHVPVDQLETESLEDTSTPGLPALEVLKSEVRANHPAVMAAQAAVEAAERTVELERTRHYPDITARLGVGVNHRDDEGFIEAGLGVPLPIFDQNQGNVLAARFAVIRARAQADAVSSELLGELAQAYRRWESAVARLSVFEADILAEAHRSYEQTLAGYQAGSLAFLDLLDAQRTLTEANIAQVQLTRTISQSLSEILEILGEHPRNDNTTGDTP